MINRRANFYYNLPIELTGGTKSKEAKMTVSINMVVPKEMEGKKTMKFIDDEIDMISKDFKKFMAKRIEKLLGE